MRSSCIVDDVALEPDRARVLYEVVLVWAAGPGERLVLRIRRAHYEEEGDLDRILALGPPILKQDGQVASPNVVEMEAPADRTVVSSRAAMDVRERAIAGELRPVEDVLILRGDRTIFAISDYGRCRCSTSRATS